MYQAGVRPHVLRSINYIELINEWVILISYSNLFLFTDLVGSPNIQYEIGMKYIMVLLINMMINVLFIVYRTLKSSIRNYKLKQAIKLKLKMLLEKTNVEIKIEI